MHAGTRLSGLAAGLLAASCSSVSHDTASPTASASGSAQAPRGIRPRAAAETEPVVVVERPSGRLELFPSGRFITRGELASRRLTEPSPPAIEVLDTAEGKVIRLASGLSLLVTKTERIEFDPST